MKDADLIQGSAQWLQARLGSVGASEVAEVVAKTKSGPSASRATLMGVKIGELMTRTPASSYSNSAMAWGTATEPQARTAYEFQQDVDVAQIGLVRHPTIIGSHASPDGLVGSDGLTEFKCPNTSGHIERLLGSAATPSKYVIQCQWQMRCCDTLGSRREWCDLVFYDPRMPQALAMHIERIKRDDKHIAELEKQVGEFIAEMQTKIAALTALYRQEEAA